MTMGYALLILLVAGVLFVNGFTDAPNAITGAVCAGALSFRAAAALAALCNTAGLMTAWKFAPRVSNAICELVDFSSADNRAAVAALSAALIAVVGFAAAAWLFGIPTSESHALIAALSGAAAALGGTQAVRREPWSVVLAGLAFSSAGGFAAGWLFGRVLGNRLQRTKSIQIFCAALLALAHGAQDGLKFVGVVLIADTLAAGRMMRAGEIDLSGATGAVILCGTVMGVGTLCGGRRIVETVGKRMVPLDCASGTASDLAGAVLLILATAAGVPMSTTHTKTCAVLGAGRAAGLPADRRAARDVVLAWGITFPVCFAVGWLITRLCL